MLVGVMRVTDFHDLIACRADVIELSAGDESPRWQMIAAVGDFPHPKFGTVTFTKADLAHVHSIYKSGSHPLHPVELPTDYEHLSTQPNRKPGDGKASGWFKDLELRANGLELWGLIDWTPEARDAIRRKEYRYFSPTLHPNWRGELGLTLIGGALTNYPTLPGCVVTCALVSDGSDVPAVRSVPSHEGHTMKIKGKNDKGEVVEIEIADDAITLDMLSGVPAVRELRTKADAPAGDFVPKADFDKVNTTLIALSTTVDTLKTDNETLRASQAKREIEIELDTLIRAGRMLPTERDEFVELGTINRGLFDKMVAKRKAGTPLVRLDTISGSGGEGQNTTSAVKRMEKVVAEKRAANPKLGWGEAFIMCSNEDPDLANAYNAEMTRPMINGIPVQ